MRLRELRNTRGLTQNELANMLGVTGQTILNWENGIYEPKISQLIELSNIFNVTIDFLVERETVPSMVDAICKQLEQIQKEEFINFIRNSLTTK